jgi:hypothetical protein
MTEGKFITKDSGERQTFSTGMQRDSAQKDLRPDLVYLPMLERWRAAAIDPCDSPSERREDALAFFIDWLNGVPGRDYAAETLAALADVERLCGREPMLVRWAELMGRGANKYGERNWEKARTEEELARFKASGFRHLVQWFFGLNPEEDHAAAVFFNISGAEHVQARLPKLLPPGSMPAATWEPGIGERVIIGGAFHCSGQEGTIEKISLDPSLKQFPYRVRYGGSEGDWIALKRDELKRIESGAA